MDTCSYGYGYAGLDIRTKILDYHLSLGKRNTTTTTTITTTTTTAVFGQRIKRRVMSSEPISSEKLCSHNGAAKNWLRILTLNALILI
ncbi:hypothetical protein M0802_012257 [Mischocyttarus mexicanus]|nr:hypothetical protein M0802_012257 [Mischocyttarus mexicanus]